MITLKELLQQQAEQHRWDRAQWGWIVQAGWSEAVGPPLAKFSRVVGLREKTVVVAVPSSSWAQELTYWKPEILKRIAAILGTPKAVTSIQLKVLPQVFVRQDVQSRAQVEPSGRSFKKLPEPRDLMEIFAEAESKHRRAVAHWYEDGYHACAECGAPTLRTFRLCASCAARPT